MVFIDSLWMLNMEVWIFIMLNESLFRVGNSLIAWIYLDANVMEFGMFRTI